MQTRPDLKESGVHLFHGKLTQIQVLFLHHLQLPVLEGGERERKGPKGTGRRMGRRMRKRKRRRK